MKRGKKFVLLTLAVLAVAVLAAGCNGPKQAGPAGQNNSLTVQFAWEGHGGSLSSPSPQILVGNIPSGTAFFDVRMKDLDRPNMNHGGGKVANNGSGVIPVGALQNYKGPQPPASEVHTYVFTVTALDADNQAIGQGQASRRYP